MLRWIFNPLVLVALACPAAAENTPSSKDYAARAVANACPYDWDYIGEENWIARSRQDFVVNDRLTTRQNEAEINRIISTQESCLRRALTQIDQTPGVSDDARSTYRLVTLERQRQAPAAVRAVFVAAGFKPSSAPPGPRYGYCAFHDDYGAEFGYQDLYHFSRVFIDRDPENEVVDEKSGETTYSPKTATGKRVMDAMRQWSAARYKTPTERLNSDCTFFFSAKEAQASMDDWKERVGEEAIDTGIQ